MAFRLSSRTLVGGYGAVVGFVVMTAGLLFAHAGNILNLGFPLVAAFLGFYLFSSYRNVYVAFVWWIWLFTPLVRRLVDYQTGYHAISPIMISPMLVTASAAIALLRNPRFIFRRSASPFLLVTIVYFYALIIGGLANGIAPALFDFADSAIPVAFALFLIRDQKGFVENRRAFMFASNTGLLLISLYGLYQFFDIPPWDVFWIKSSNFASAGLAISEQIRLFGPLNSPGPYGDVLMMSLVYLLVTKGPLRIAAGGLGFPAFGLSLVRASWLGWAGATIFLIFFSGGKTRVRLIWLSAALAVVALPLVTVGPVAGALSTRLATFNNIQQDKSYQSREKIYEYSTLDALADPIGAGFGGNGLGTKLGTSAVRGIDSGILQIPFEFGWVFGALFVWALLRIAVNVTDIARKTSDGIVIASAGIYVALILENFGAPIWGGIYGMTLWIGAAFAMGPVAATAPGTTYISDAVGSRQLALSRIAHEG